MLSEFKSYLGHGLLFIYYFKISCYCFEACKILLIAHIETNFRWNYLHVDRCVINMQLLGQQWRTRGSDICVSHFSWYVRLRVSVCWSIVSYAQDYGRLHFGNDPAAVQSVASSSWRPRIVNGDWGGNETSVSGSSSFQRLVQLVKFSASVDLVVVAVNVFCSFSA